MQSINGKYTMRDYSIEQSFLGILNMFIKLKSRNTNLTNVKTLTSTIKLLLRMKWKVHKMKCNKCKNNLLKYKTKNVESTRCGIIQLSRANCIWGLEATINCPASSFLITMYISTEFMYSRLPKGLLAKFDIL